MGSPSVQPFDGDMVAVDHRSRRLATLATRVAETDVTVLISGESGTGKEILARFVHNHSRRAGGPFIAINCAAIPENMLEALLFGHEKGTFTGAHQSRAGKFEQAQGGTLLLDEISEMALGLQAKLLRVLQENEVERLGGRETIPLNVRVLATTNREMRDEVAAGRFREDLYYRLNVFPLKIAALRDRPADILPLTHWLLDHYVEGDLPPEITPEAAERLQYHDWPGNVRELENVIQRALILANDHRIGLADICIEPKPEPCRPGTCADLSERQPPSDAEWRLGDDLKVRERELIVDALVAERGSRKDAAARLGISPRTLRYKLARLRDAGMGIPPAVGKEYA